LVIAVYAFLMTCIPLLEELNYSVDEDFVAQEVESS
jgi:hypothetical protein